MSLDEKIQSLAAGLAARVATLFFRSSIWHFPRDEVLQ